MLSMESCVALGPTSSMRHVMATTAACVCGVCNVSLLGKLPTRLCSMQGLLKRHTWLPGTLQSICSTTFVSYLHFLFF